MSQHSLRVALVAAVASSGLATAQQQADPQAAPTNEVAPPQTNSLALWFGHVESDNIARTASPEDGSYKETIGVFLDFGHQSQRLDANVDVDLQYRNYSSDAVDGELVGTLHASATIDVVEDRFSWSFNDAHGQGITDPYSGIGPGNREQINVLSTAPLIDLPLGRRTSVELGSTLSRRRFEESTAVDSDSTRTHIGFYRQISATARFGLVMSSDDVEYVDVIAPDYEIEQVRLRYEKELATGRVLADLGTNEISAVGLASDGPLYDFKWTRSLTARSDLSIQAVQEITDAGGLLVDGLAPGLEGASFTDVIVAPSPFEQRRFSVSYQLTMSRTVVSARIGSFEDDYVSNSAADNDSASTHLSFVRTITPQLSLGISYDELEREFVDETQPDSVDSWTGAWLYRTFGRRLFLGIGLLDYDRRTALQSYGEQRWEIRFGYSPTDSEVAALASTRW